MDKYKCFVEDPDDNALIIPLPCKDIHEPDVRKYFIQFCMFIIIIMFIFFIRPIVNSSVTKYCCLDRDDAENNKDTSEKEIQCNIEIGYHKLIIHPDNTLNTAAEEAL